MKQNEKLKLENNNTGIFHNAPSFRRFPSNIVGLEKKYTKSVSSPDSTNPLEWTGFDDKGQRTEKYKSKKEMLNSAISSELAEKILKNAEKEKMSADTYLRKIANKKQKSTKDLPKVRKLETRVDFSNEEEWLKENRQNFINQWVVLDGKRLIGHGDNPVEIVKKARLEGVKIPFVEFISDDSEPTWGGWL